MPQFTSIDIHCELTEDTKLAVTFDEEGNCELLIHCDGDGMRGKLSPNQVLRLREFLFSKGEF